MTKNTTLLFLKLSFYELLITLVTLSTTIHPVEDGDFWGLSVKQWFFLTPIVIATLLSAWASYRFAHTSGDPSVLTTNFFNNKTTVKGIGSCAAILLIGTIILVVINALGKMTLPGGLYTLILIPAIILISAQVILYVCLICEIKVVLWTWKYLKRVYDNVSEFWTKQTASSLKQKGEVRPSAWPIIERIFLTLIALCLVTSILRGPISLPLGLKTLDFRYGYDGIVVVMIIALFLVFASPGWKGRFLAITLTLFLFALPLWGIWSSAYNESNLVRGLIPWSDANGYYTDALRLLNGELFSNYSSRRPLFAGLLSALLALTSQNLQITLIILMVITALACYLAAREIQNTHGALAATLFLTLIYFFYRRFSGTTMTEILGLAFGATGFALIWSGTWRHARTSTIAGIFLLSLGLFARAGDFFILPILSIWAAWYFRGEKRFSATVLILAVTAVAGSYLANLLVFRSVASPGSLPNASMADNVYGLVLGGASWNQINQDHPEFSSLFEVDRSKKIYDLSWQIFRRNPSGLMQGVLNVWSRAVSPAQGVFGFITAAYGGFGITLSRWALLLLSAVGLVLIFLKWHEPHHALIIAAAIGIFFSTPLALTWDYMRVHAATIPFVIILPIIGLIILLRLGCDKIKALQPLTKQQKTLLPHSSFIFGVFLASFTLLGPLIIKNFARPPQYHQMTCPSGLSDVYISASSGSYLKIITDQHLTRTWVPEVKYSHFVNGHNYDFYQPDVLNELSNITTNSVMIDGYNLESGVNMLLFADLQDIPNHNTILGACGRWSKRINGFYYAETVEDVSINSTNQ